MTATSHHHYWKPGPLVEGHMSFSRNEPDTPTSIILVCGCDAVTRVRIPKSVLPTPRLQVAVVDTEDEAAVR